jgi:hypothetical protein
MKQHFPKEFTAYTYIIKKFVAYRQKNLPSKAETAFHLQYTYQLIVIFVTKLSFCLKPDPRSTPNFFLYSHPHLKMWAYYAILLSVCPFNFVLNLLGDFNETWYKERSHCVDVHIIRGPLSNFRYI